MVAAVLVMLQKDMNSKHKTSEPIDTNHEQPATPTSRVPNS